MIRYHDRRARCIYTPEQFQRLCLELGLGNLFDHGTALTRQRTNSSKSQHNHFSASQSSSPDGAKGLS